MPVLLGLTSRRGLSLLLGGSINFGYFQFLPAAVLQSLAFTAAYYTSNPMRSGCTDVCWQSRVTHLLIACACQMHPYMREHTIYARPMDACHAKCRSQTQENTSNWHGLPWTIAAPQPNSTSSGTQREFSQVLATKALFHQYDRNPGGL